jgi:predicted MFS family arabinose efflux permease
MVASLLIGILGDLMYALSVNSWMIIVARLLVGICGANYTVTSSYVSTDNMLPPIRSRDISAYREDLVCY